MLTISRLSDSTRFAPTWLLLALLITISAPKTGLASKEARDPDRATLLALGKYDSDNDHRTSSHGTAVLLLNSKGELVRQIFRPTVSRAYRAFGGCRGISVSQDGRFFVVCGNSEGISMYETSNGFKLWSLPGSFGSAVFADDLVYALGIGGVYAIDRTGTIVKHSRIGLAIDIAFDSKSKCLWIVGKDIKKYSMDLKLLFKVRRRPGTMNSGTFSIDLNSDGSVWVAERHAYGRETDGNRLMKISPEGRLLKVIQLDFCPQRVRVNRSDGSVWTTGRVRRRDFSLIGDKWPETVADLEKLVEVRVQTYTCKYDSEGKLLLKSTQGGTSIDVDPSDGSVWVAGGKSILHYSSTGANLAKYTAISGSQKWLAIVP